MLADVAALALSLIVIGLVGRPAKGDLSLGLKRPEILSVPTTGVVWIRCSPAIPRFAPDLAANRGRAVKLALRRDRELLACWWDTS